LYKNVDVIYLVIYNICGNDCSNCYLYHIHQREELICLLRKILLINTFLSSIGVVYALDDGSEELIVDEHKENQENISVDTEVYRPNSFDALAQFI